MSHTHDDEQSRSVEQALYLRDLYRWAPAPAPQQPPHGDFEMSITEEKYLITTVFELKTGEKVRVSFRETLGVEGYALTINTDKSLVVMPSSGNAIVITTQAAAAALEAEVLAVVANRDRNKPARAAS